MITVGLSCVKNLQVVLVLMLMLFRSENDLSQFEAELGPPLGKTATISKITIATWAGFDTFFSPLWGFLAYIGVGIDAEGNGLKRPAFD